MTRTRFFLPFAYSDSLFLDYSTDIFQLSQFQFFQIEWWYEHCPMHIDPLSFQALYVQALYFQMLYYHSIFSAFIQIHQRGPSFDKKWFFCISGMLDQEKSSAKPAPPPRFTADHPFVFGIYNKRTKVFLFWGRIAHPTAIKAKDELWDARMCNRSIVIQITNESKADRTFVCLLVIGNIIVVVP